MSTVSTHIDAAGEAELHRALRHFWHPVMYTDELGDGPQGVELLDERLVVVRLAGKVRVFPDLCVHRGTALSLGWVEDDQIRCAYHGWTYGPDGACTSIPARHGPHIPGRARLDSYRVAERNGLIWVSLDPEPVFPIPDFPEFDDPSYRVAAVPVKEWKCSAARRLENFVDFAHIAWVHDNVLGTREHPEVADHKVWREGAVLRFGGEDFVAPSRTTKNRVASSDARHVVTTKDYRLFMPLSIHFYQTIEGRHHFILFVSACPVRRDVTRFFTFNARDYELEEDDERFISFQEEILEQDRPVVESQRPEELPFDLSAELHIRGVDRVSIEYRKWLIELTNHSEGGTRPRPLVESSLPSPGREVDGG